MLTLNGKLYESGRDFLDHKIHENREKLVNAYKNCILMPSQNEREEEGHLRQFVIKYIDKIRWSFIYDRFVDATSPTNPVKNHLGISNIGNSCWLNSCMQSLLSSKAFIERLDQLNLMQFPQEIEPVRKLMEFLKLLKQEVLKEDSTAASLSKHLVPIRDCIFNLGLGDYNLKFGKNIPADPSDLYATVLNYLGFSFIREIKRTANFSEKSIESVPIIYRAPGNFLTIGTDPRSIGEGIVQLGSSIEVISKWHPNGLNPIGMHISDKILGTPPKMIVIQKIQAGKGKHPFYKLLPTDFIIDLKPILSDVQEEESTQYQLVSFVQYQNLNANQGHWIAYGKRGGKWYYFNDSISRLQKNIIKKRADYLIYELITSI